jgi:hypothetical protein
MVISLIRSNRAWALWFVATFAFVALLSIASALHAQSAESNVPGYAEQMVLAPTAVGEPARKRHGTRCAATPGLDAPA